MVARRTLVGLVVAGSLVAASVGGSVALAQSSDAPAGVDDAALLVRLDELEVDLPAAPAPTAVELVDAGEEGDETWGQLEGDITGAAATLATLEPDLSSLYVDADDADTPVGDAVADVARGWLDLREAYDQLATWEAHDLVFPLDARDDEGTSTDADELRGRAEAGLRLVLGARQRHLTGYVALRQLGEADPDAQARLDARAADSEAFDRDLRPLLHRLVSLRTTELLAPVDRFESTAPGVDARARSMTVTCVDRQAYDEAVAAGDVEALLEGSPERLDCPDLADELRVELVEPQD